ncbi:hypothetical protein F4778DRAFT_791726 [Xylariomycetidae sp. FL2044]|nr:hypothetical protein F4778DRAFT_791726 [Xylariomycetidae sp. FL2044]
MVDQVLKRKPSASFHSLVPGLRAPPPKQPKIEHPSTIKEPTSGLGTPKKERRDANEVIVIDDDEDGRDNEVDHALRNMVQNHDEDIQKLHNVRSNLTEQMKVISDRTQQTDFSLAEIQARVGTKLDDWKMDVISRLEALERARNTHGNPNPSNFLYDVVSRDVLISRPEASVSDQLKPRHAYCEPCLEAYGTPMAPRFKVEDGSTSVSHTNLHNSRASLPSATLPSAVPGLILSHTAYAPANMLSNSGLQELLRQIDFTDPLHLKALIDMDSRKVARDCTIFSDIHSFPLFKIDYVLRSGTTVSYIEDHSSCDRRENLQALKRQGLQGLRVLEMNVTYATNDKAGFKEWRKHNQPPKYVYDLGQLFMRRKGAGRYDLHGTQYNLVMDVTNKRKSVWLVDRPEFIDQGVAKRVVKHAARGNDSTVPFQTQTVSLNGAPVAKLFGSISDLILTRRAFDGETFAACVKAMKLALATSHKGNIGLCFRFPDPVEMGSMIGANWNKEAESVDMGYGHEFGDPMGP